MGRMSFAMSTGRVAGGGSFARSKAGADAASAAPERIAGQTRRPARVIHLGGAFMGDAFNLRTLLLMT